MTQEFHNVSEIAMNERQDYFATLDRTPTAAEDAMYHQIRVGAAFREWISVDAVGARIERQLREKFVEGTTALISCNPTDTAAIHDAQLQCLAATMLFTIISDAISQGDEALREKKVHYNDPSTTEEE